MNIYDIKVRKDDLEEVLLSEYKGKVLLIVNTATGCGFTPQYEGLQNLYDKYKDRGFYVLDFPCNQFGNQASGTIEEINAFCGLKYKTTFPRFDKVLVNGDDASSLFKYLKKAKRGLFGSDIKWNFTKFLINRDGSVIKRYSSNTEPSKIEKDILRML
jgi:glutathione peroxidase